MLIGNTPLVKLSDKLYGKLESVNPGGSIKDRPVKYILDRAEEDGLLKEGDTILKYGYDIGKVVKSIRYEGVGTLEFLFENV